MSSGLFPGACDTEGSNRGGSDSCSGGAAGSVAGIGVAFGGEPSGLRVGIGACSGSLSELGVGSGFDGGACFCGGACFGVGEGELSLGVASSFDGGCGGGGFSGSDCFGVGEGERPLGVASGFDGGCGGGGFSAGGASPASCGGCCGSACCCG